MSNHQALVQTISASTPATIGEVIAMMQSIDKVLTDDDGLKWFNLLYLMVTTEVESRPPLGGWADPHALEYLDVVFANLYFQAIIDWKKDAAPRAWQVLFEARYKPGVARIQFALCGMNAHINHDLPLALVQTDEDLNLTPATHTPQHQDFDSVNTLLDQLE